MGTHGLKAEFVGRSQRDRTVVTGVSDWLAGPLTVTGVSEPCTYVNPPPMPLPASAPEGRGGNGNTIDM